MGYWYQLFSSTDEIVISHLFNKLGQKVYLRMEYKAPSMKKSIHSNGIRKLLFFMLIALISCQSPDKGKILTVTGPIDAEEVGLTLTHEHLLVDFIGADSTGYHRWNKDSVTERIIPFLEELQQYGLGTFVDCTPAFLGRDPWMLQALSEKMQIHILTNTGYYGAHSNKYVPGEIFDMTVEEISAIWIDEFVNGIEGSGVRPGFIKIAVDPSEKLSDKHRKLVTAAILTHKETGMVIASHTGPEGPAFAQLALLEEHKVHPSAFIWVHAQRGNIEANIEAARMGAWISLDNLNSQRDKKPGSAYSTDWYADRLLRLKEEDLLHQVLLSHDAGWYKPGEPNGGSFRGFTDIFTKLIPALTERGFTEDEIRQMMVHNPATAFSIR